jgi:hypothetical protein
MKEVVLKRTIYIPDRLDKLIRHQAVEENKRFSDVAVECFRGT